ncbi:unnamed protein product [Paramecium sonneborni]|uniref:Uncharacterized protein n=1 Tax=Paramecium sonneborni TaxID=65129 RepID=A0A8S1P446_9CILI|nr:unnamed protein product [Paramecium sonneborni]
MLQLNWSEKSKFSLQRQKNSIIQKNINNGFFFSRDYDQKSLMMIYRKLQWKQESKILKKVKMI